MTIKRKSEGATGKTR